MGYFYLYQHVAVQSMDDVWTILCVPPARMLKTLVLGSRGSDRIAFCCVRGDKRIDMTAVRNLLSGSWSNVTLRELKERGLVPGAISPFTAPPEAIICLDDELPNEGLLYLGSGDPCLSIAVDAGRVRWPQEWKVAKISQRNQCEQYW
jgi:prolyl-tRNA editing enzyme YbaK/EbsC (Cys-tRNA(Pro) deacylase)